MIQLKPDYLYLPKVTATTLDYFHMHLWLDSGVSLKEEVANYILTIPEAGVASHEIFREDRLSLNKSIGFHTPIQRKNILLFAECKKLKTITKINKSKTMEDNRNILGKLLSIYTRH